MSWKSSLSQCNPKSAWSPSFPTVVEITRFAFKLKKQNTRCCLIMYLGVFLSQSLHVKWISLCSLAFLVYPTPALFAVSYKTKQYVPLHWRLLIDGISDRPETTTQLTCPPHLAALCAQWLGAMYTIWDTATNERYTVREKNNWTIRMLHDRYLYMHSIHTVPQMQHGFKEIWYTNRNTSYTTRKNSCEHARKQCNLNEDIRRDRYTKHGY